MNFQMLFGSGSLWRPIATSLHFSVFESEKTAPWARATSLREREVRQLTSKLILIGEACGNRGHLEQEKQAYGLQNTSMELDWSCNQTKKRFKCGDSHSAAVIGSNKPEPMTLFQTCIDYTARNIHIVESFYGFPDIIGVKIFQTAKNMGKFRNATTEMLSALRLFCEAYESDVISSLSLHSCHLGIADYFDHLCLFSHLSELDISDCGLGDDHELLQHAGHLGRLTKLGLGNNALSDKGVQRLTTPVRMFRRGPVMLQVLDLSGNPEVTCRVARYLKCFGSLARLNLSGTAVRKRHIEGLEHDLKLTSSPEQNLEGCCKTENRGWASDVVSDWMTRARRPMKSASKPSSQSSKFYKSKAKLLSVLDSLSNDDCASCKRPPPTCVHLVRKEKPGTKTSSTSHAEQESGPKPPRSRQTNSASMHPERGSQSLPRSEESTEDEELCSLYTSQKSSQPSIGTLSHFLSTLVMSNPDGV